MRAEQVTEAVAFHGEGPVWSARWGGLRWVDMLAGDILSLEPDGSPETGQVGRRHVSEVVAALRPRVGGGSVLAIERGFALEDADGTVHRLEPLWTDPNMRMNEGGCDPAGGFSCGSMAYDHRFGAGSLYRLDPDGRVQTVVHGVTISNGLEWSPDGSIAYYCDTSTQRVDVFDYDTMAGLGARRPFIDFSAQNDHPDGLTVDALGGVWVAFYGGSAVRRYTAAGVLDEVIELPTPQVTACTFGGPQLDELFITTSQENLEPGSDPLAGALFRAEVGVAGLPVREYTG